MLTNISRIKYFFTYAFMKRNSLFINVKVITNSHKTVLSTIN
jgi:hypothetical protein